MSPPAESTPFGTAAMAFEVALSLAGAGLLLWLLYSARGRAARQCRLPEWRLPPLDFACYALAGIVGTVGLSAIASLVVRHAHLGADATAVVGSALMEGGFLLGLGVFHFRYASTAGTLGGFPAPGAALRSGAATFLVAMPLVYLASNGWEFLLVRLGLPDEKQELVGILENTHSAGLKIGFILVATIIVPVAEELVFRAGIYRYFRTRFPRWFALLFSSLLFGAPHVDWSRHMAGLPSLAPLVVLAFVFCLAYEVTGSIATTIVAHAMFNLNMILLVLAGIGS